MYKIDLTKYNKVDFYYEDNNVLQKLLIFIYKNIPLPDIAKLIILSIKKSRFVNSLLLVFRYFITFCKITSITDRINNMIKPIKTNKIVNIGGYKINQNEIFKKNCPELAKMIILDNKPFIIELDHPLRNKVEYKIQLNNKCSLEELLKIISDFYINIYNDDKNTSTEYILDATTKCYNCLKYLNIKSENDYTLNDSICFYCKAPICDNICSYIGEKCIHLNCLSSLNTLAVNDINNVKCLFCNNICNFKKILFFKKNILKSSGFNKIVESNGKYGVWGYKLNNLIVKELLINKEDKIPKITLNF